MCVVWHSNMSCECTHLSVQLWSEWQHIHCSSLCQCLFWSSDNWWDGIWKPSMWLYSENANDPQHSTQFVSWSEI